MRLRRHAIRALALTGALLALSVPVLSATSGGSGFGFAIPVSACSGPDNTCSATSTISGTVGSFYSGITISPQTSNDVETQLCGEPGTNPSCPSTVTIPANLAFGISDYRGQAQGLSVFVGGPGTIFQSAPGTPAMYSFSVGGSAFVIAPPGPSTTNSCFGACSPLVANPLSVGMNLAAPVCVASAAENLGDYGLADYGVNVPYNIVLSGFAAEEYGLLPGRYTTAIPISYQEGSPTAC